MRFADFRQYRPKTGNNVFVFICEDSFLIEQSREVWQRLFGGSWSFEKLSAREFQEIPASRLMEDARTPSLFSQNKALLVTGAEKLNSARAEDLTAVEAVRDSSLKIVLVFSDRKSLDVWARVFSAVEIDPMKPGEAARWVMDEYGLTAEVSRYLVESVGTELYQLHSEIEKLRTYAGEVRPIETRDVDTLILRSEQFGAFELDDAVLARDYKKAVQVVEAMLENGDEPPLVLSRIVRVWRQILIGKGLTGKTGARDIAIAANAPVWKAGDLVAACRQIDWRRLALGFRELLYADRAFKSSSPNPGVYFDVLLWKLIGSDTRSGRLEAPGVRPGR
jgi:DNA polymerase III delta subunit